MSKASEYTIKRIDENHFELWHDDQHLATMTKKEAWPVMTGQIHPGEIAEELAIQDTAKPSDRSDDK